MFVLNYGLYPDFNIVLFLYLDSNEWIFFIVSCFGYQLSKPYSNKPTYKFGTTPFSHTDITIKKYFYDMHSYMRQFNKTTVMDGVAAVENG